MTTDVNTRRFRTISLTFLIFISGYLAGQTVRFGSDEGWDDTVSENLRETSGWRGEPALTLSPLGRNPFLPESAAFDSDVNPANIDLLLLAEPEGMANPAGRYRIAGSWEISSRFSARGEVSVRPVRGGVELYPSSSAMWAPGRKWGDFTLDFRLRPSTLREGEVFFSWQGRTADGSPQSVTAKVERRRLVWIFQGFFRHDIDRSLTLRLESPPLIPGEWRHHRIRFTTSDSDPDRSGASPGLLEYLVDGIPSDMVHATPYGREGSEPYSPLIGELSSGPIRLAPDFSGYLDEFRLAPVFDSAPPAGGYSSLETAVSGRGRTNPQDSLYPGSLLKAVRYRVYVPGASRVRFYAKALDSEEDLRAIGLPEPGGSGWIPLNMNEEPEDPTGFGRWYSWDGKTEVKGRFFVVGYILDPDPGADLAPVLSALNLTIEPRFPPRPPQDLRWERNEDGRIHISWNGDVEEQVAGWWISWGPRPGDYAATGRNETVRGTAWVARDPSSGSRRPEFVWPEDAEKRIIYTTVRAAWREGAPSGTTMAPGDYRALSESSREIYFRP